MRGELIERDMAWLDPIRHKNAYEIGYGRTLGYILHKDMYALCKSKHADELTGTLISLPFLSI
jgi:hypothetical protein